MSQSRGEGKAAASAAGEPAGILVLLRKVAEAPGSSLGRALSWLNPRRSPFLRSAIREWVSKHFVECSIAQCRRFHVSHPWLRRTPGILLGEKWYCGEACLRDGAEQEAKTQAESATFGVRRPPRMPYRLVLLARGVVTELQIEEARALLSGPQTRGELGETLVQLGYATEDQVAAARAAQEGCAFLAAEPGWIPPAFRLPLSLMRRYQVAPVRYVAESGRLLLGFVQRVEPGLLHAAGLITACHAEPCIITRSAYREQIRQWSAADVGAEEGTVERIVADRPEAIAALVLAQAVRCGADEVRMTRIGGTLWLRLAGEKRVEELIVELVAEDDDEGARSLRSRSEQPKKGLALSRRKSAAH